MTAEARLDFVGDSSKAQAAYDKLLRENAKLRESVRTGNEEAKKAFKESSDAVNGFSDRLSQSSAKTNAWADGMKRLREQFSLANPNFSAMLSSMQKTVALKEPFAPWAKGLENLRQQGDKWAAGMKRMEEQREKLKPKFYEFGTAEIGKGLDSIIGQYVTIAAATAGVVKLYSAWRTTVDGLGDAHRDLEKDIVKTLAEAGKLQLLPQVQAIQKQLAAKGITPHQSAAAFAGAMTSGTEISQARQMEIAAEASKLGPTQIDLTKFTAMATNVAEALGDEATPERVIDITAGLKRELGEKAGGFGGQPTQKAIEAMKRKGLTGEQAIAHVVTALQAEQSPRSIAELFGPGRLSREQMMVKKQLFGGTKPADILGRLEASDLENLAQQQLQAVPGTTALSQMAQAAEGVGALGAGDVANVQDVRKFVAQRALAGGGGYRYSQAAIAGGVNRAMEVFRGEQPHREAIQAAQQGFISMDELRQLIEALNRNTKATEKNNAATDQNTTATPKRTAAINTESQTENAAR